MSLKGPKQETERTVELPKWIEDEAKRILERANVISQQPYELYPHSRLAPLNADHQAAFDLTRMLPGKFGAGGGGAGAGSGDLLGSLSQMLPGTQEAAAPAPAAAPEPAKPPLDVNTLMEWVFGPGGSSMVDGRPEITRTGSFTPTPSRLPGIDPSTYGQTGGEAVFMQGSGPTQTWSPLAALLGGTGAGGGGGGTGGAGGSTGGGQPSPQSSGTGGRFWDDQQDRWVYR